MRLLVRIGRLSSNLKLYTDILYVMQVIAIYNEHKDKLGERPGGDIHSSHLHRQHQGLPRGDDQPGKLQGHP